MESYKKDSSGFICAFIGCIIPNKEDIRQMSLFSGMKSLGRALVGKGRARSLDGASMGRPLAGAGTINNLNADILAGTSTIRRRTAYLARNSAHVTAAVNALVSNIVGPGIRPISQHPDPAMREHLHEVWSRFVVESDADGAGDFYAQQALMCRQMVETGESFARFRPRLPQDGLTIPLQLQILHPSHCPVDTLPTWAGDGATVRCGIEYDQLGRRSAFWFYRTRPDDPFGPFGGLDLTPVRVPAADVLHLMDVVEPGQIRGLSWLNAAVGPATELDRYQAAALKRAQLSNMIVGAIVDPGMQSGDLNGQRDDDTLEIRAEPGTFFNSRGKHVEFFDPKESQHYGQFVKSHLKSMSCAIGIPYELLSHDLAEVNYSSIRAGLVEFQKRLEHWQYNVLVFRVCRPVWDRFIRTAVLAGHIPAAAYHANPADFHRVEWLPPVQESVDPLKDVEADALAIEKKLVARSMVIARRGYVPEQVDALIAADEVRERQLGITAEEPQNA